MIRLDRHPWGPRLYVAGLRVHHGSAALLVASAAALSGHRRVALAGLAVVAHDVGDFPWRDCDNHDAHGPIGARR